MSSSHSSPRLGAADLSVEPDLTDPSDALVYPDDAGEPDAAEGTPEPEPGWDADDADTAEQATPVPPGDDEYR